MNSESILALSLFLRKVPVICLDPVIWLLLQRENDWIAFCINGDLNQVAIPDDRAEVEEFCKQPLSLV